MRILILDDDPHLSRALARQLRAGAFDVQTAGSASSALALLSSQPFDAVLSDLDLGGDVTGLDFLALVARLLPHVGRILMTGLPGVAIDASIGAVLEKPFALGDVVSTLGDRSGAVAHAA